MHGDGFSDEIPIDGEGVRAVIWDLDDTLWQGTITEGGVTAFIHENETLVVDLARRGIISSICSKNDFESAKKILTSRGLWEYFVFPSIDWSPKGPRIARIVEALQLRAETVLFLDDHPQNLAAARALVPGMLTAPESFVAKMRSHPRFSGKDDSNLSRLNQYRVMELRKLDEVEAGEDSGAFLRNCAVKVRIEYDVAKYIDRAIELINRTNQLNFTKIRLPENIDEARRILLDDISHHWVWSGLVHVEDRYGDYGYVGFFLGSGVEQYGASERRLKHFCFSCRTIGMEVETYIYRQLGRPRIKISGEVIGNLWSNAEIDWINHINSTEAALDGLATLSEVRLHGGCDMDAMMHYFGPVETRRCQSNFFSKFLFLRRDTSANLVAFLTTPDARLLQDLGTMGVDAAFTKVSTFEPCSDGALIILSLWGDHRVPHFRHRATGALLAFDLDIRPHRPDLLFTALVKDPEMGLSPFLEHIPQEETDRREAIEALAHGLVQHFEYVGRVDVEDMAKRWYVILSRAPKGCRIAIFIPPLILGIGREFNLRAHLMRTAMQAVAAEFEFARVIDPNDCILSPNEVYEHWHFNRLVYYRLSQKVSELFETAVAGNWPIH